MQSKILDFEIEGTGNATLFGDFGALKPTSVHGIAHCFKIGTNAIITFYSETGVDIDGARVCSADMRLSLDETSIESIIKQLNVIRAELFPGSTDSKKHLSDNAKATVSKSRKETLGPPM